MTREAKVKHPILTLYAFHLWADFDEGYQTEGKNAQEFWLNFAQKVGQELKSADLQNLDPDKLNKIIPDKKWENLLPEGMQKLTLSPISIAENLTRKGAFRAERIQDAYVAELTLSCQEKDAPINPRDLKAFNPNGCLLQSTIKASLGSTIFFYAEPETDSFDNNYRALADACVKGLIDDNKITTYPQFIREGKLLGSPIFEYDNHELNPLLNCHILVWLKQNPNTLEQVDKKFDLCLKNLLLYSRKVLYGYYRAREWYAEGQKQASNLEKQIPDFAEIEKEADLETRLAHLKSLLTDIRKIGFEYSKCLRFVRESHNTVTINIANFEDAFKEIKSVKSQDDNLVIWQFFLNLVRKTYLKQIEFDLNYLIAGQNLFQEMMAIIQGMLDIEQIEADREIQKTLIKQITESRDLQKALLDLQNELKKSSKNDAVRSNELNITIGSVGAGIAIAGVVATSYGLVKPEQPLLAPWDQKAHSVHPFIESISWSFLVSGVVVAVVLLGRKIWPLKNKKQP